MLDSCAPSTVRWLASLAAGSLLCLTGAAAAETTTVTATIETAPVPSSGDAADDPAIWIHPTTPASSRIYGTDKDSGLYVYDLSGAQIQALPVGQINNVDLRTGFPLGAGAVDLVTASNRSNDSLAAWSVDPVTGLLTSVQAGSGVATGIAVYGYCMYKSPITGKFYGFVNSKDGDVEQYELFDDGSGAVTGTLVRSLSVGSTTEGCVADDETAQFYISEEVVGIWRYGAEPGDGSTRSFVDGMLPTGNLTADVEGLSIYYTPGGGGYLIASSQGSSNYVIYDRAAPNAYVGTFSIVDGVVDGSSDTDGLDVTNAHLGASFPSGAFVTQDGLNDVGNQNFKFVPWESIANSYTIPLTIDTSWSPRPECADGVDNDGDLLIDLADPGCVDASDTSEGVDCTIPGNSDTDDFCDDVDNCLLASNPTQLDTDSDGYGNLCDGDYNNDGFTGGDDFAFFRGSFGSSFGSPFYNEDIDSDGDGTIGGLDFSVLRGLLGTLPGPSGLACAGTVPCP